MSIQDAIKNVYTKLKNRDLHPAGKMDNGGRWYAENGHLINVREPSRAYPWSQMQACRTLKYVKAIVKEFNCQTESEIINRI